MEGPSESTALLISQQHSLARERLKSWEYAGYGSSGLVTPPTEEIEILNHKIKMQACSAKLLTELPATAICGNDILGSVLYTFGICTVVAGKLAPVCLGCVSIILYQFRWIYAEVS